MLVLSRKVGEKILVGDNIVITIVRVQGDKVRVGVDAPDEISIVREEIAGTDAAVPQAEAAEAEALPLTTEEDCDHQRKVAV